MQKKRTHLLARKECLRLARVALEDAATFSGSTQTIPKEPIFPSVKALVRKRMHLEEDHQSLTDELARTRRILLAEVFEALTISPSQTPGCAFSIGFLPVQPLRELQSRCSDTVNITS